MIDLNVRSVKSEEIDGERLYALSVDRPLCTHCAKQRDCKALKSLQRASRRYKIAAQVRSCREYAFPILFVDPKGTDSEFNTIRLGLAWLNRLKVGEIVGLVNKQDEVFGYAEVTDLIGGSKEMIIKDFAFENHLYLDSGLSQSAAGAHLWKTLPNIYGNLIVKNNQEATVIYLKKCGNI